MPFSTENRGSLGRLKPGMAALAGAVLVLAGCSSTKAGTSPNPGPAVGPGHVLEVVAAENFWGSIARQLGGTRVHVTSIVTNPNADPHSYEPTTSNARTVANAQMVIVNGIGYDPWAAKLLATASVARTVLNVGDLLRLRDGDNPHRWYSPADVQTVISVIVSDYSKLDPADTGYYQAQRVRYDTVDLAPYNSLIGQIKARYAGTPVGASESIFSMLAPALGLDVVTPYSFLRAISEGTDVSASDTATIDTQIHSHRIKIYVYNSQNTTPDIQSQLQECKAAGIPTTTITETLVPAAATYQAWQTAQLRGILSALHQALGK